MLERIVRVPDVYICSRVMNVIQVLVHHLFCIQDFGMDTINSNLICCQWLILSVDSISLIYVEDVFLIVF